jgi:hypothetical protein
MNPHRSHRPVPAVRPPVFPLHLPKTDRPTPESDPPMVDSTARVVLKRGLSSKRKGVKGPGEKPEVCLGSLSIDAMSLTLAKETPKEPKLPAGTGNGNDAAGSGDSVHEVKKPPHIPPFVPDPDGDPGLSMLLHGFTTFQETDLVEITAVRPPGEQQGEQSWDRTPKPRGVLPELPLVQEPADDLRNPDYSAAQDREQTVVSRASTLQFPAATPVTTKGEPSGHQREEVSTSRRRQGVPTPVQQEKKRKPKSKCDPCCCDLPLIASRG